MNNVPEIFGTKRNMSVLLHSWTFIRFIIYKTTTTKPYKSVYSIMQCHSDNGIQLIRDTEDYFLHLLIYQPFLGMKHEEFFPYIAPQIQI